MNFKQINVLQPKSEGFLENKNRPLSLFSRGLWAYEKLLEQVDKGEPKGCYIGSSCMYPDLERALVEDDLGKGPPHSNNALFSYTNLLAWQLCKTISKERGFQYFVVIPSDIFGDPKDTHFIPQIMSKMHAAKVRNDPFVTLLGTGAAVRHPIFQEDFQNCFEEIADKYEDIEPINIATPVSYAKRISSIAMDIKEVVGFKGEIHWDAAYSDGQSFKVLNTDKLAKFFSDRSSYFQFTPWIKSLEKTYERMINEM